jgi:hypothetical protein
MTRRGDQMGRGISILRCADLDPPIDAHPPDDASRRGAERRIDPTPPFREEIEAHLLMDVGDAEPETLLGG